MYLGDIGSSELSWKKLCGFLWVVLLSSSEYARVVNADFQDIISILQCDVDITVHEGYSFLNFRIATVSA